MMKKNQLGDRFMKTFTAFLFALLFCFNAFAWPKSYHPVSFSDEIIQKDVDTYNEEMKKCDQTLNKDTKAAKNTGQMIKSNQNVVSCYEDIIYQIIKKYYSESIPELTESHTKYIKQVNEMYDYLYTTADKCGAKECKDKNSVLAKTAVAKAVRAMLEEYVMLLKLTTS